MPPEHDEHNTALREMMADVVAGALAAAIQPIEHRLSTIETDMAEAKRWRQEASTWMREASERTTKMEAAQFRTGEDMREAKEQLSQVQERLGGLEANQERDHTLLVQLLRATEGTDAPPPPQE